MRVLITGASGYIGGRVADALLAAGHEAIAAGRRSIRGLPHHPFDLEAAAGAPLPPGTGAVLHLAAHTGGVADPARAAQEVAAAEALIDAARSCGARFVFVSSQTARADAPTAYGRTKWRIEQAVLAAGGVVLRPGQVYGGEPRGLFGTLVNVVERRPVLPAFLPAPRIQPVHVDDLAAALLALLERPDLQARVVCIGAAEPVTFTRFIRAIASGRVRRPRLFVPVPTALVRLAARATGGRVAALERLGSLFALPAMHSADDLALLGLQLRPLELGMGTGRPWSRRAVLAESRALLRYVLGEPPSAALVRRQARAVETLRGGLPLELPGFTRWAPPALRWFESRNGKQLRQQEFSWRLDSATALAEASLQGARRFLGLSSQAGAVRAAAGLTGAVAAEAFWRLSGLAVRPLLRWH